MSKTTEIKNTTKVLNNYLNKYHDNMVHELVMGDDFIGTVFDCAADIKRFQDMTDHLQKVLDRYISHDYEKKLAADADLAGQAERLTKALKK